MKKIIYIITTIVVLGLCIFAWVNKNSTYKITGLVGTPTDYTKTENWMHFNTNPKASVDMIFFYPTAVNESKTGYLADIDDNMKKTAQNAYNWMGSTFAPYTNVFVPYYRQIPLKEVFNVSSAEEYTKLAEKTEVRTDVYAALDEYFSKHNNNRPFILAGHSQGSAVLRMVLSDYMKAHPEYLDRMVAAYLIGYPVTQKWLDKNPHLKFAKGENDTGVIVSWNTEGPNPTKENFLVPKGTLLINPINWKLDETPATVSENKGSLNRETMTIGTGNADATIDLKRGTVVCTTVTDYVPERLHSVFGDKSLHTHDYDSYYANIRENGKKRIDAYLKSQPTDYSKADNWMHMDTNPKHKVDLIYFYPTSTPDSPDGSGIGVINDKNKKLAQEAFNRSGSAFSSYTNVFAPYYRQMAMSVISKFKENEGIKDSKTFIGNSVVKTDAFAALDYYFNNLNNGRPFIISSHSQGSIVMQLAFEEYFSKHPEYLDRMVAGYIIGWPVTKKWLADNNLKFAKGETDTGVIISWNTEGPNSTGGSDNTWLSINPLNWKLDETPATVSENKGTLHYSEFQLGKGLADATINKERGTIICTTNQNYITGLSHVFGEKNLHIYDYNLYYGNIQENGKKRVDAYLGNQEK